MIFPKAGGEAFAKDIKKENLEFGFVDAGHFALESHLVSSMGLNYLSNCFRTLTPVLPHLTNRMRSLGACWLSSKGSQSDTIGALSGFT